MYPSKHTLENNHHGDVPRPRRLDWHGRKRLRRRYRRRRRRKTRRLEEIVELVEIVEIVGLVGGRYRSYLWRLAYGEGTQG